METSSADAAQDNASVRRSAEETGLDTGRPRGRLWHVTANEASAVASSKEPRRRDTSQDTPPASSARDHG